MTPVLTLGLSTAHSVTTAGKDASRSHGSRRLHGRRVCIVPGQPDFDHPRTNCRQRSGVAKLAARAGAAPVCTKLPYCS